MTSLEIPQIYRFHLFACLQGRPPEHPRGSCGQVGAQELYEYLNARLEQLGNAEIGLTATGCLGFCSAGPLMLVYPEGIWYTPRTRDDIDEIIKSHLSGGLPVERMIIVPRL
ncbi:MAG TPA: Ferredoxin, 2Fe-2S [Hyphomicrobiaceae bacterium MAG_BT-2024]